MSIDQQYKPEFPERVVLSGMRTRSDGPVSSASWDDKEIFIRKVFEEDPKKGCELIFKQYYQPLCSHVVRFVYSKEIAEDIVGDVFYTFWEKQLHLHITSSYRAYLFIAVRNRSLKHIRREFGKMDDTIGPGDTELVSLTPTPLEVLQYNELYIKIDRAIQSLTPRNQKVFLMNRFEGKKYQEIACELKVSVKAVEAHISKALNLLRKAVRN